ncbi:YARHG domain-containing protein [Leptotrichia wadei]|uniref:YARHG domain-containing protein n=1 Tax=Leptotrichia wadei TaxID=157687 RepID=UPI0028DB1CDB|nr:YARHG domain-containing protein [Leptotrichia wadei]
MKKIFILVLFFLTIISCQNNLKNVFTKTISNLDPNLSYQNELIVYENNMFSGKIELQSPLQGYVEVKNGMLNGKVSIIDGAQKLEATMEKNDIQSIEHFDYQDQGNNHHTYKSNYRNGILTNLTNITKNTELNLIINSNGNINGTIKLNGNSFSIINNEYSASNFGGFFPKKGGTFAYYPNENTIQETYFYNTSDYTSSAFSAFAGKTDIPIFNKNYIKKFILTKIGLIKSSATNINNTDNTNTKTDENNNTESNYNYSDENSSSQETTENKNSENELDLEDLNNLKYEVMDNGNESAFNKYGKNELRILRNMIYAEKGYIFKDEELASFFNKKSWYKPEISNQDDIQLDDYDKQFILKLKKYEDN